MAVVIRLQGLSIEAGSEDIRRFFGGLKIPDGGVHIIGGEREEAFIIFASDEDARRAMTRSGGFICDSSVTLLLSSKTEMQNMLENSTKTAMDQKRGLEDNGRRPQRSVDPHFSRRPGSRLDYTPSPQHQSAPNNDDFLCLFLKGLPFSVTEKEVFDFFGGLCVDEIVLLKNQKGLNKGTGFVKFATREDAAEGLKRDKQYIGSRYVDILPTTVADWRRATGRAPTVDNKEDSFERRRSPVRSQRNPQHHMRSPQHRMRSRSPVAQRHNSPEEYCVLLDNLSFAVEKEDIKQLYRNAKLEDDQILHLRDSDGKRTRSAFVLFKSLHDYCDALSHETRELFNRLVYTRPISKEKMISLLESQSVAGRTSGTPERFPERPPSYPSDPYTSEKICVYVQNLPFDVRKVEIMDFFHGFNVTEDKVYVLRDHEGAGVGKALVLFRSETEATRALSLNGRRFLGSEVILKGISRSQMQQLGVDPPVMQEPLPREVQYSGRRSEASYSGDTLQPDLSIPPDDGIPATYVEGHGGWDYEPHSVDVGSPRDRGNGIGGTLGSSVKNFDDPTCVKLLNLPFQIRSEEIYDFCYGYHIIPGSVSLQCDERGKPKGSATLVFESRREALTAIEELSGRPIGPRKIKLILV
ncbi:RNA binding motif protein 12Bb [Mugil cephalus]|uniref:RNA binding motif protein 12Bb n=1 Tax=Mugil cephalus TaxID=48193 RepID=UPI001FB7057E|nr:RNA binding motif protein 12Bb [Mugil cephalus]